MGALLSWRQVSTATRSNIGNFQPIRKNIGSYLSFNLSLIYRVKRYMFVLFSKELDAVLSWRQEHLESNLMDVIKSPCIARGSHGLYTTFVTSSCILLSFVQIFVDVRVGFVIARKWCKKIEHTITTIDNDYVIFLSFFRNDLWSPYVFW